MKPKSVEMKFHVSLRRSVFFYSIEQNTLRRINIVDVSVRKVWIM